MSSVSHRASTRTFILSEVRPKLICCVSPCQTLVPTFQVMRLAAPQLTEGVPLILWRAENEMLCLIGLYPNTAAALDLLHINHLGVMLLYCRHVVWEFLRSGVWVVAASNRTENLKSSALGRRWYASRRRHPTENLTQVADVTPSLSDSMEGPKEKKNAAETWCMLLFLVHCLRL